MALIECIPNISEGRRPDVVADMASAIRAVPGVRLLDFSSDASHNRSVFTLAGDAAGVEQAVMALFERAVAAIDLRTHHGEHPRMGAVDVVPFVPIEGVTMAECVALAKKVGAAVADRFKIPVYLYVKAAGFKLEDRGIVQVSMNLTNYEKTPIFRVFETVKREAERYGVSILESEIVGLVPSAALNAAAEFYLQIEGFKSDQVLENKLRTEN